MAKSNSFFGLRHGSTKSHTYSVYRGKQITKDRVEAVSDPKTLAQATQRMHFASCAAMWRCLSEILDHSWENVKYGGESYNHFLKLAMASGATFTPVNKGEVGNRPSAFPVSSGSLQSLSFGFSNSNTQPTLAWWYDPADAEGEHGGITNATMSTAELASFQKIFSNGHAIVTPVIVGNPSRPDLGTVESIENLVSTWGLKIGDQITVLASFTDWEEESEGQTYFPLSIFRGLLQYSDGDGQMSFDGEGFQSSGIMPVIFETEQDGNRQLAFIRDGIINGTDTSYNEDWDCAFCAVIVSRPNDDSSSLYAWKRSSQSLLLSDKFVSKYQKDTQVSEAIASYRKTVKTATASAYLLNESK